jgi:DNA polymerase-3 subunit delta'
VGKATLAWRFTRALLTHGDKCPDDLAVAPDHRVSRQVGALTHPDLIVIRRAWDSDRKRHKTELGIEEVRRLHGFFAQHSALGGYRVAIVDAADDMNRSSQNALLKILEEPPSRGILILIAHAPGSLLPTTRSRCRALTLRALQPQAMSEALAKLAPDVDPEQRAMLAALAEGAPGRALELVETDAVALYRDICEVLRAIPRPTGVALYALAERVARASAERGLALFTPLLLGVVQRVVRGAHSPIVAVPGEDALLARLRGVVRTDAWGLLWDTLRAEALRADELNLDKKQVVLNAFFAIEAAAR